MSFEAPLGAAVCERLSAVTSSTIVLKNPGRPRVELGELKCRPKPPLYAPTRFRPLDCSRPATMANPRRFSCHTFTGRASPRLGNRPRLNLVVARRPAPPVVPNDIIPVPPVPSSGQTISRPMPRTGSVGSAPAGGDDLFREPEALYTSPNFVGRASPNEFAYAAAPANIARA